MYLKIYGMHPATDDFQTHSGLILHKRGKVYHMIYDVYNYLISDYVHKSNTQYKAHNSTELKDIYNKIVKMSQKMPLYLFHLSDDIESFALDLKDSSIQLANAFSYLANHNNDSAYSLKTAYSEDVNVADASIVSRDYSSLPEPFMLEVHSLARSQKNLSNAFHPDYSNLPENTYHFAIETDLNTYEYKLHIPKKIPNEKVFSSIASSINLEDCGIHASIIHDKKHDKIQLCLESDATGSSDGNLIFNIYDLLSKNSSNKGIVSCYGLDQVVQTPKNSSFSLNGEEKTSMDNEFTLHHSVRLSLKSVSDTPVQISYQPDYNKILSNLNNVLDSYNHLIDFLKESKELHPRSSLFINELKKLTTPYEKKLGDIGIMLDDNSHLLYDPIITNKSILNGSFENFFSDDNEFTNRFLEKLHTIILNPVEYIDKVVVTYPNPLQPNFPSPYVTSIYSGMLFNNYC